MIKRLFHYLNLSSHVYFIMDISAAPVKKSILAKQMIKEVSEALKSQSPAQVSSQFSDYQKNFPTLFAILLRPDYPREVLSMMIEKLELVEGGQMSQHDASVAVGSVLVNQFVKPQINPANH